MSTTQSMLYILPCFVYSRSGTLHLNWRCMWLDVWVVSQRARIWPRFPQTIINSRKLKTRFPVLWPCLWFLQCDILKLTPSGQTHHGPWLVVETMPTTTFDWGGRGVDEDDQAANCPSSPHPYPILYTLNGLAMQAPDCAHPKYGAKNPGQKRQSSEIQ